MNHSKAFALSLWPMLALAISALIGCTEATTEDPSTPTASTPVASAPVGLAATAPTSVEGTAKLDLDLLSVSLEGAQIDYKLMRRNSNAEVLFRDDKVAEARAELDGLLSESGHLHPKHWLLRNARMLRELVGAYEGPNPPLERLAQLKSLRAEFEQLSTKSKRAERSLEVAVEGLRLSRDLFGRNMDDSMGWRFRVAESQHRVKNFKAAEPMFVEIERQLAANGQPDPLLALTLFQLSCLYNSTDRSEQAVRCSNEACRMIQATYGDAYLDHVRLFVHRIDLLRGLGRVEEALEHAHALVRKLKESESLHPALGEVYLLMGPLYDKQQDDAAAARYFRLGAQYGLNANHISQESYFALMGAAGVAYQNSYQGRLATELYLFNVSDARKHIDKNSTAYAALHYTAASFLWSQGHHRDIENWLRAAADAYEQHPDKAEEFATTSLLQARYYLRTGELWEAERAVTRAQRALAKDSYLQSEVRLERGELELARGNWQGASDYLESVPLDEVHLMRLRAQGGISRAVVRWKLGDLPGVRQALADTRAWIECRPHSYALAGVDLTLLERELKAQASEPVAAETRAALTPIAAVIAARQADAKFNLLPLPNIGIRPKLLSYRDGVVVEDVGEDYAAGKAGIKVGDTIIGLGGTEVTNFEEYREVMARYRIGETLPVVLKRGAETVKLEVLLAPEPEESKNE